jgi:hypothetical protein
VVEYLKVFRHVGFFCFRCCGASRGNRAQVLANLETVRRFRMKSLFTGLVVMTLAFLTGCGQEGTPGGPGTIEKKPAYGQADDTFNLSVPVLASSLQQGEQAETTVGIKRAKNFDEDVTLKFANVPEGVTVEPASPVIKHGDTDAKITFKAGDEAPLGNFKVNVTGHPTKGTDAQVEFTLAIAAKDTVSKKSEKEHAAVGAGTPGLTGKQADIAANDGTIVSITGDKLVMTNKEGIEHSHALSADAKLTLDGNACTAADLKPGTRIRLTLQSDAPHAAIRVEAIEKNPAFASL